MNGTVATIGRDLGRILQALAGLMLASILVPLIWGEYYTIPALVVSALIPLSAGWLLTRTFRGADDPGKLHGMMVAASGWFFVGLFGSLPFLLIAWTIALDPAGLGAWTIALDPAGLGAPDLTGRAASTVGAFRNPINGVFESMSGFTGTGLTMTDDEASLPRTLHDEASLPRTLQWWRSFIEWIGRGRCDRPHDGHSRPPGERLAHAIRKRGPFREDSSEHRLDGSNDLVDLYPLHVLSILLLWLVGDAPSGDD